MVTEGRVHILTRDGLDGPCFGCSNKGQMRLAITLRRRIAAFNMRLDKPPNQVRRRRTLLPGKRFELPEHSFRKFHGGPHIDIVARRPQPV